MADPTMVHLKQRLEANGLHHTPIGIQSECGSVVHPLQEKLFITTKKVVAISPFSLQ